MIRITEREQRVTKQQEAAGKVCIGELLRVLRKHGFLLSHEDPQGAFELELREHASENHILIMEDWLLAAEVVG